MLQPEGIVLTFVVLPSFSVDVIVPPVYVPVTPKIVFPLAMLEATKLESPFMVIGQLVVLEQPFHGNAVLLGQLVHSIAGLNNMDVHGIVSFHTTVINSLLA